LTFLSLLRRQFPTSRPVDWSTREAGVLFLRSLERRSKGDRIAAQAAATFRRAVEDRNVELFRFTLWLIRGLATNTERCAADLRRSAELMESAVAERELALLDRQAKARSQP